MGEHEMMTNAARKDEYEYESGPRIGRSVSIDRAAEVLGVSRRTIYNRIRDGRLQSIRTPGGSQRILIESLPPTGSEPDDRSGNSGAPVARRPGF
jgi:excisionase family DNA binding protein